MNPVVVYSHVDGDYRVHLKLERDGMVTLCGAPAFSTPMRDQRKLVTCKRCSALKPSLLGGEG